MRGPPAVAEQWHCVPVSPASRGPAGRRGFSKQSGGPFARFDSRRITIFKPGTNFRAEVLELDPQAERHARYEPFREWGHDSLVFPQLSYDSTRGLLLGAYLQRTSYGFGLDPYESRMNLCDIPEPGASRVRSRFPHALAAERPPLRRVLGDRAGEVLPLPQ